MKKNSLFLLLCLTSCFWTQDPASVVGNARKQKEKIDQLQKKLIAAEEEQKKAELEVEKLSDEVQKATLVMIRKELDELEKQIRHPQKIDQLVDVELSHLFGEWRESLHEMMQNSSPYALEAEGELDRILRIITELSDNARR